MSDEGEDGRKRLYEVFHWYKDPVVLVTISILVVVEIVLIYGFRENLFERTSNWTPFLAASVTAMSLLVSVGAIVHTNSLRWMHDSKKDLLAFYDTYLKQGKFDVSIPSEAETRLKQSESGRILLHIRKNVKDWAELYAELTRAMNEAANDQERALGAIFVLWGAGISSALFLILAPIQIIFLDAILFSIFVMVFMLEALAFYLLVWNVVWIDAYSGFENKENWLLLDLHEEKK